MVVEVGFSNFHQSIQQYDSVFHRTATDWCKGIFDKDVYHSIQVATYTHSIPMCSIHVAAFPHKKTHHTGWEIFSYKAAVEQITNCLMNFMIRYVICVCITIIFVILSCSLVIDAVNNFEQRQRALRFLLFYWNTMLIFYAGSLAFWLMNNKTLSPDAVQHSLILPAKQTKP